MMVHFLHNTPQKNDDGNVSCSGRIIKGKQHLFTTGFLQPRRPACRGSNEGQGMVVKVRGIV